MNTYFTGLECATTSLKYKCVPAFPLFGPSCPPTFTFWKEKGLTRGSSAELSNPVGEGDPVQAFSVDEKEQFLVNGTTVGGEDGTARGKTWASH